MDYDVIIIGAGIAGLTAGIYAGRAEKRVLILERKIQGGQIVNALKVENWPGKNEISGLDLIQDIYKQALKFGIEVVFEEVLDIKRQEEKFVVETSEAKYVASAVILATGAEPRKLSEKQLKEVGSRAVSYCATCDGALFKGKPVVVVGSGNTAKHEIEYLEGVASKVYHIHHDDPIPEDAVAVFVAIGRVPATEKFAELVDLDVNGYVLADETCVTSCPGVFVAGDCRTKAVRQLVTAAADGAVAAEAAVQYLE